MSTLADLPVDVIQHDLVLVSDVIDRPHVVCLHGAGLVDELPPADCRRLTELLAHEQASVADEWLTVPWYGTGTAHGHRILPTETGLAELIAGRAPVVGGAAA